MSSTHPVRIFGFSVGITIVALIAAYFYGGIEAFALCAILGVLEITLSFDNAVVNAQILERMSPFWQKIFLSVGIVIAVFGMRLVFPLVIVAVTAGLNPVESLTLALEQRPESDPTSYAAILNQAYPQIAAFGGMFLYMLFLDWMFTERDVHWLSWLERPLVKIGQLNRLSIVIAVVTLVVLSQTLADNPATVLVSGAFGLVTYLSVKGLGDLFEQAGGHGPNTLVKATGKAGFFLFLYLEVLDAAFSFDGVIGAFAVTTDPIIIALGLGVIGAFFVRSLTVYMVRKGTLDELIYLEHGAHWAIGALSIVLLMGIGFHVNEVVTGLIGVAFIGAAFTSSILHNRKKHRSDEDEEDHAGAMPMHDEAQAELIGQKASK